MAFKLQLRSCETISANLPTAKQSGLLSFGISCESVLEQAMCMLSSCARSFPRSSRWCDLSNELQTLMGWSGLQLAESTQSSRQSLADSVTPGIVRVLYWSEVQHGSWVLSMYCLCRQRDICMIPCLCCAVHLQLFWPTRSPARHTRRRAVLGPCACLLSCDVFNFSRDAPSTTQSGS